MKRRQFHAGVGRAQFRQDFLERMEFRLRIVNVVLINFVGEDEKFFFVRKFDDFFDVSAAQDLP